MPANIRFHFTMDATDQNLVAPAAAFLVAPAAALMGMTMAGFLRVAAKEKALSMLFRESHVTLSQSDFSTFSRALVGPFNPNLPMKNALTAAKKSLSRF